VTGAGRSGGLLDATLASDETRGPVSNSVQSLARQVGGVLDNPADGVPVAHTMMTFAQSAGAIAGYLQAGIRHVEWSSARDGRVCRAYQVNAAAGPLPIGEKFPSGTVTPPACQGCGARCCPAGSTCASRRQRRTLLHAALGDGRTLTLCVRACDERALEALRTLTLIFGGRTLHLRQGRTRLVACPRRAAAGRPRRRRLPEGLF
jgi:hypothetical protein